MAGMLLLGGATTLPFNNGKSQLNFNAIQSGSGEYPFMNLMKTGNIQSILTPDKCDANGFPTTGGGSWGISQPSQNQRAGSYYLRWTGTGVASFNIGTTKGLGSFTPSGGVGFVEVTPTSSTVGPLGNAVIISFSGPAQNVTYCHNADDAAVQANPNEWHPQFMAVNRLLNCGVLRFLNWASGNASSTTTWASRAPTSYASFAGTPLEANNYGGADTLTGTDISVSTPPGGFVLQDKARLQYFIANTMPSIVNTGIVGTATNGSNNLTLTAHGLVTGNQIQLGSGSGATSASCTFSGSTITSVNSFVADQAVYFKHVGASVLPSNVIENTTYFVLAAGLSGSSFQIATSAGGTPITFTGSPSGTSTAFIAVPAPFSGVLGSLTSGNNAGTNPQVTTYFVTVIDANTVTLSATSGGSAITFASGGSCFVCGYVTISVGGGPKIPMFNSNFYPYPQGFIGYPSANNTFSVRVLVYDATFGAFVNLFSTSGGASVPPELCLDLCYKLGAHPWFCIPYFAADPATDFLPQLATLIQNTYQNGKAPWMIPRFEIANEIFNTALQAGPAQYANRKSGYYGWTNGFDWEGKVGSILGQACANVFGYANKGTKYHWIMGVNTTVGTDQNFGTGTFKNYFNSNQFMTNDPNAVQSPYTRTPAFVWLSHLSAANYVVPSANTENAVVSLGFQYTVTNAGNPTAQAQNAADYVDSLGGSALHFNSAQVITYFTNWVAFGQGVTQSQTHWTYLGTNYTFGVDPYEGGYSPDYGGGGGAVSTITGATVTSGTTVDLTCNGTTIQGAGPRTGNAAVNGMYFAIANVVGMTQLNSFVATFTNGSASISGTNGFVAGQVVYLTNANGSLPTNFSANTVYYVSATGLSGSAFQVSASNGGSVIVAGSAGSGTQTVHPTFQVSNVSGNTVTITTLSTAGFGAYTSGGSATYYQDAAGAISADTWIQTMRGQGKLCTSSTAQPTNGLGGWLTALYTSLAGIGVPFPSCYFLGDVAPPPSNDVWSIMNDVYQCGSPPVFSSGIPSPQALAIQIYNH